MNCDHDDLVESVLYGGYGFKSIYNTHQPPPWGWGLTKIMRSFFLRLSCAVVQCIFHAEHGAVASPLCRTHERGVEGAERRELFQRTADDARNVVDGFEMERNPSRSKRANGYRDPTKNRVAIKIVRARRRDRAPLRTRECHNRARGFECVDIGGV